ncbi:MAG: YggT family protein, partial [Candidatus Roizmanbacteria bacterium]
LALRILLKFLGANPTTPIVNWLYETTGSLIAPFSGIFPNPKLSGFFTIDVAAIIALVVYSLIAYVVLGLISDFSARYVAHRHA